MGGIIGFGLGVWATWRLWEYDRLTLAILAGLTTVICFWSFGVMHNFATENAKRRSTYQGGFFDFTTSEVHDTPNWPATTNMISTLAVVILLVASFF